MSIKSNWKKCKLINETISIGDGIHGTPTYDANSDVFFINGNNLLKGHICLKKDTKRVSSAQATIHQDILGEQTILISINGTLGNVAYYCNEPVVLGKSACYVNINSQNDKRFFYYLFSSPMFQQYLHYEATGTTIKNVSLRSIRNFEFLLPTLEEQKRIAEILGSLDDKIELLQKQNKTLEDMAKALFKSWFVDFDVVRAKQKGLPKADIMREYHLTDDLYDLFPSSFADSPLGPIPSGWEVKNVGELLAFSIGGGWGNEEESESFPIKAPVIRGTDIPSLRSSGAYNDVPVRFHKKSNHTSRELKEGDIVLEVAGGSKGQPVGRALFVSDYIIKSLSKVICASFCKLLRPNKKLLLSELFYLYLDMVYQTGEIEQYQVQSTGISNFQFKQFCEDKQFVIPNTELQKKLSLNVYIDKIGNNKKQIQTLTELRDTLLPRLISGKIRV